MIKKTESPGRLSGNKQGQKRRLNRSDNYCLILYSVISIVYRHGGAGRLEKMRRGTAYSEEKNLTRKKCGTVWHATPRATLLGQKVLHNVMHHAYATLGSILYRRSLRYSVLRSMPNNLAALHPQQFRAIPASSSRNSA